MTPFLLLPYGFGRMGESQIYSESNSHMYFAAYRKNPTAKKQQLEFFHIPINAEINLEIIFCNFVAYIG